jgi:Transposase and inactivated derivatives
MPDHFHLLLTPCIALERAIQFVKGGFSYKVKKELGSNLEIWQQGFADHRIRDWADFDRHMHYIHFNPVKKGLCESPSQYPYSSAFKGWKLDPMPQGLKPKDSASAFGGMAKATPFQGSATSGSEIKEFKASPHSPFPNSDSTGHHATQK